MPCRIGLCVSDASGFRARTSFRRRRPRGWERIGGTVCGRKPRLGNIATPGRACPPHNETYDCRIYPNGIGCLRRGGGSGTGRPTGQEPAFRADPTSERDGLPVRSARFPIRANGKLRRAAIPTTRRKTRENGKKRDEFPGRRIRPEAYQNRKYGRGERPERPRVRFGFAEPGSEESSCDRSPGGTGRPFSAEAPGEPGTPAKPDYILCYTNRSGRCFRLILPDGRKPFGMEPAGKCLHLAHSVY